MAHELVKLNLTDLAEGHCLRMLEEAMDDMAKDVIGRPNIVKPREITLRVSISPEAGGENGGQNWPKIEYDIKTKKPGVTGMSTQGKVADGQIMINAFDRVNPNQTTLAFPQKKRTD